MTDEEYQKIYSALDDIRSNLNQISKDNTHNNATLDYLKEEISSMSKEQEKLKSVIYNGNYGRNSILEEVKIAHGKINQLEDKLEKQNEAINSLEDRWVKFLWTISITIIVGIVISLLSEQSVSENNKSQSFITFILRVV